MKNTKSILGLVIALILAVLLLNPGLLPLPPSVVETMQELKQGHFLLHNDAQVNIAHILMLAAALCVIWVINSVLTILLNLTGKKKGRSVTVNHLLLSIIKYLSVIIAIFWGLSILGVNTAAVLASVGIIGLIVGFGAQSLIEDILTGIFIIFEGEYNIGDIIILDDFRGIVRNIGVRTTVIEDAGGNLKIVNNSDIRNLQNRSKNSSLAICEVGVAYETDIRAMEKMLENELPKLFEANRDIFLSAPVYMGINELGDYSVVLAFSVETKEDNIFIAKRRLNRELLLLCNEQHIEIPSVTRLLPYEG